MRRRTRPTPNLMAGGDQVGVDPADPGIRAGGLTKHRDQAGQRAVAPVPLRGASVAPGVLPGPGHTQAGAHEGHIK